MGRPRGSKNKPKQSIVGYKHPSGAIIIIVKEKGKK